MKQTAEISVYFAGIGPLLDPAFFERAMQTASPERRDRANRFRFAEGRARSLGAELLLRKALLDLGSDVRELKYGYGPQEKPYLIGVPEFHFNLSHSGDYVMLAAADREVGCDIEEIARYDLRVAKRFFAPEEYECIAAAPPEEQQELFFRYWTLKESFVKVTGRGLNLPMSSFEIRFDEAGRPSVRHTLGGRCHALAELQAVEGYCSAAAAEGECLTADCVRTDLREIAAELGF